MLGTDADQGKSSFKVALRGSHGFSLLGSFSSFIGCCAGGDQHESSICFLTLRWQGKMWTLPLAMREAAVLLVLAQPVHASPLPCAALVPQHGREDTEPWALESLTWAWTLWLETPCDPVLLGHNAGRS